MNTVDKETYLQCQESILHMYSQISNLLSSKRFVPFKMRMTTIQWPHSPTSTIQFAILINWVYTFTVLMCVCVCVCVYIYQISICSSPNLWHSWLCIYMNMTSNYQSISYGLGSTTFSPTRSQICVFQDIILSTHGYNFKPSTSYTFEMIYLSTDLGY